jgi:hypothetical protein
VIVNLIAATTTTTGLPVRAEIDPCKYPKRVKASDQGVAEIRLERDKFHGSGTTPYSRAPLKCFFIS